MHQNMCKLLVIEQLIPKLPPEQGSPCYRQPVAHRSALKLDDLRGSTTPAIKYA